MNLKKSRISEKKLSGAIFGFLVIAAFGLIFGPNIYAQFARQTGSTGWGNGYGYGYGYGYGDGGATTGYRTDGPNLATYNYGNGYGYIAPATTTLTPDPIVASGGSSLPVVKTACSDVTYSNYQAICASGLQYRDVVTRTPANCVLTAAQQALTSRACNSATPTSFTPTATPTTFEAFVALEKSLVKKVSTALSARLSGRILLQVQSQGQAWYVYPVNTAKYFLGRPADAFSIMRKLSLGVSNQTFATFKNGKAPEKFAGRIFLKVQDNGRAYYVNPVDLKMYYLGRPSDAFSIMRKLGLGTANSNLRQIKVGTVK